MHEFGLTGGIGSGKSTVGERLVGHGARLVDADAIVRDLQEPGEPVFVSMVDHFGPGIVGEDGRLNRQAVADIVFSDKAELDALNAIVHPAVGDEMQARRDRYGEEGVPVILDIPLLVESLAKAEATDTESPYGSLAGVIVVDVPVEIAVQRLVESRGFDAEDARSRIANQVSREDRLARADFVVDNSGSLEDLAAEVERCWSWIQQTRS